MLFFFCTRLSSPTRLSLPACFPSFYFLLYFADTSRLAKTFHPLLQMFHGFRCFLIFLPSDISGRRRQRRALFFFSSHCHAGLRVHVNMYIDSECSTLLLLCCSWRGNQRIIIDEEKSKSGGSYLTVSTRRAWTVVYTSIFCCACSARFVAQGGNGRQNIVAD